MTSSLHSTIAINQLGYRETDSKKAIITEHEGVFYVVDLYSNEKIFQGTTTDAKYDDASGMVVSTAEFSSCQLPGTYYIELEQEVKSYPFIIGNDVYHDVHRALLKAFYYLRCGVELEEQYAGVWKHGTCHISLVHIHGAPEQQFDGSGGWHDAGDYGKYIVAAGKAVADLLLAYEWYPQAFTAQIPLPESNEHMADVLHECKVELDWMLRMQDQLSGGVYHKLTTLQFPPIDMMPEDDLAPLFASPISATATASFAATLALAARIYQPLDEDYASYCLQQAKIAWTWLEEHPSYPDFHNPIDVGTGEYGDPVDRDERYWAAAELYRTTGEEKYHEAFLDFVREQDFDHYQLGWVDMGGYGTICYLLTEHDQDEAVVTLLRDGLQLRAAQLVEISKQDGYGISMLPQHYVWGSNMNVMNNAMLLLIADRLFSTSEYVDIVTQHVHYIFGANVMGTSYVTGYGSKPMMNPHHRPSIGDGIVDPIPGMLSGGPNKNLQDEIATTQLQGAAPAAAFIDHIESYATNEITIYWNSPAVFVLSHFV
ncbi:glycoside hydrolase family 9 protein [Paenibacillus endoradicis]|uniref:glycoside hydrolase family 9 protein n=1 Tax=Paenibacillus endoradicis TaxID=2972487 RepID=UPI0021593EED|nr:glycoside hydrolase family 9 protein [Paenibacillus endoradicis]MCR8658805.1 glycoside hydrolase family 9 protein [Paenibacillus endoradicis]